MNATQAGGTSVVIGSGGGLQERLSWRRTGAVSVGRVPSTVVGNIEGELRADGQAPTGIDQVMYVAHPFSDVQRGPQFFGEIAGLADSEVTKGYAEGGFRPPGTVNRDAMPAFLYRFADEPEYSAPATSPFRDAPMSERMPLGWEPPRPDLS